MSTLLALSQIDPVLGDLRRNVEKHLAGLDRARAAGASLVVFPELSLTGYSIKDLNADLAVHVRRLPSELSPLVEESRKGVTIVAGGVEEGDSYALYNAAFLFEEGAVRVVHRKIYPPTYGMFEEMRYFSRGEEVRAFSTRHGRLGVLICEDLWHLPLPYLLACDGATLLLALVASPTRLAPGDAGFQSAAVNSQNQSAYARLLSVYVAFCNRVGFEDGINFWGGSLIVGPDGDPTARAKLFEEDLIVARIDEEEIRKARRYSRHFLDDDPRVVQQELQRIGSGIRGSDA